MSGNKIDLYVSGPPEIDLSAEQTSSAMMAKDVLALKNRMTNMEQQHKTDITKIQEDKAEKGSTLSEYGIDDAYTKTETDGKIKDIQNSVDKLNTDVETLQDQKADTTYVDSEITTVKQQLETQKVDLTEYVKNTDYATATKGGVVKIKPYAKGLSLVDGGILSIYGAERGQIAAKESGSAPIVTYYQDYAVSKSTHQDMSDDYDVSSLKVGVVFEGSQSKLPASYEAVKGYIDGITGDIDTALDNIIAIQNALIGGDSV